MVKETVDMRMKKGKVNGGKANGSNVGLYSIVGMAFYGRAWEGIGHAKGHRRIDFVLNNCKLDRPIDIIDMS